MSTEKSYLFALLYFGLGGGKIKRNFIHIALLLSLIMALSISAATAANTNQTDKNTLNMAAGSTTTTSSSSFTVSVYQLNKTANNVKNFIDKYNRLPNYVTVSGKQITTSQYLLLLSNGVVNLNKGTNTAITVKTVNTPTNPSQTVKSGSLTKTEYVKLAGNLKTFVSSNGRIPNYLTSSLGKIRAESLIYMYSKVIIFYGNNKRLPNTVSVTPWTGTSNSTTDNNTTDPNLTQYLQPTANCPSTDATITSLSATITAGLTTNYLKAVALFNWVRDNLTYSYYYNSKKGALGALSARTANCCDHSHLLIALSRAAGLPARYQHGYCKFSDGWFGHVWAQIYVDGTWYNADAINDYNNFGVINNWNQSTVELYGTYAELPF